MASLNSSILRIFYYIYIKEGYRDIYHSSKHYIFTSRTLKLGRDWIYVNYPKM